MPPEDRSFTCWHVCWPCHVHPKDVLCTCFAQDSIIGVSNQTLCRAGPSVDRLKPGWPELRMLFLADSPPETAASKLQLSHTSLVSIQQLGGSCLEDQADLIR